MHHQINKRKEIVGSLCRQAKTTLNGLLDRRFKERQVKYGRQQVETRLRNTFAVKMESLRMMRIHFQAVTKIMIVIGIVRMMIAVVNGIRIHPARTVFQLMSKITWCRKMKKRAKTIWFLSKRNATFHITKMWIRMSIRYWQSVIWLGLQI